MVSSAQLHSVWPHPDEATAQEKAALVEASVDHIRAILMQLEEEGHASLGEDPIFV